MNFVEEFPACGFIPVFLSVRSWPYGNKMPTSREKWRQERVAMTCWRAETPIRSSMAK